MKKIAFILCVLAMAGCTSKNVEVGPYTVSVIEDGIFHIQDCTAENPAGEVFDGNGQYLHFNNCSDMYLLVGETDALLIDLSNKLEDPTAEESLRKLVKERIGDKPLTITVTHNHGDHTGMVGAFLNEEWAKIAVPREDFKNEMKDIPEEKYIFFDEGYEFDLGGVKVASLTVAGHTAGSTVFFAEGRNILFAGDAIGSGHGVWIFNTDAFDKYLSAVPRLIDYIRDPANGIDETQLKIFGGHWWQRDWLDLPKGEMGMDYILDMQTLLNQMEDGTAKSEPSNLDFKHLDTYFRYGNAIVTWNAAEYEQYTHRYAEKRVYRGADVVIRQIDEHTWEGNGHLCFDESIYIVEGSERALLIDAGTDIRNLDKIVASITDKPVTLVATHVHSDHTGSAVFLFPELYFNAADTINLPKGMPITENMKFLTDGQVFDLGGRSIEVMFTPGHTPGSVTFFDKEKHYGFSGDAFGSTNLLLTTSFSTLISTTAKTATYMKANGIGKLFPGHYAGDNPETLQRVEDLNTIAREMLSGKRKGLKGNSMGLNAYVTDFGVTVRYRDPEGLK